MLLTRRELKRLQSINNQYPSVSIYVPTHRTMPEKEQDKIRVKNLFKQAEDKLKQEFKVSEIEKLLENLNKLKNYIDYENTLDSLVVFANKNGGELYYLPEQVKEQVIIDQNFQTRVLEKLLDRNFFYWVLALSEKPTRLYMGFKDDLLEVKDTQVGKNQEGQYPRLWQYDITEPWTGFPYQHNYDVTSDRELLAVETGDKDSKYLDNLRKDLFREVDRLLSYHVNKENPAPIIILGTPENLSIFKNVTQFKKNIIGENSGDFSHEGINVNKILEKIKPIISNYISEREEKTLNEFKEAIGTLHHASGFDWVWRVAKEGRIKILLVEEDFQVPGTVDENNEYTISKNNGSQKADITGDLVDNLIELVKSKSGEVVFLNKDKLKEYNSIAAILRY